MEQLRRVRVKGFATLAALVLAAVGGTACEPPPPRTVLVVDSSGAAPDAVPGDGTCATTSGSCTLAAAIDEGNALGQAAVTLPAGSYDVHGETITGTLWINDRTPELGVRMVGRVTVGAGGALVLDGAVSNYSSVVAPPSGPLRFRVEGALVLRDVQVGWASATDSVVDVAPNGLAVIDTSFLGTSFATTSVVANQGWLWLRHTWLMNIVPSDGAFSLLTTGAGRSVTGTSAIAPQGVAAFPNLPFLGCGGTPPVSDGYNGFGDASCGLTGTGDRLTDSPISTGSPIGGLDYALVAGSPLVDAIPIGVHGCGSEPWGDWYGHPLPADGNGDGTLGCDIGPKELQAVAPGSASTAPGEPAPTLPPWGVTREPPVLVP